MSELEQPNNLVRDVAALALAGPAKTSALKAVKTLIFGTADYGAAWFERWAGEVRAGTAARLAVSEATARAASASIAADQEIADRAVQAWLPQAVKAQKNRERILGDFVDEVKSGELEGVSGEVVSDDWIERYAEFAGKISDEDIRRVLVKLLICEIRSTGSVPISTLRTISELDSISTQTFQKYSGWIFGGRWMLFTVALYKDPEHQEILDLNDAGLLMYPDTNVGLEIELSEASPTDIAFGDTILRMFGKTNGEKRFVTAVPLTRAGRHVYSLIAKENGDKPASLLADQLMESLSKADLFLQAGGEEIHVKNLVQTVAQ